MKCTERFKLSTCGTLGGNSIIIKFLTLSDTDGVRYPKITGSDLASVHFNIEFQVISNQKSTVKPLNCGHHWFSEKVSAIERCPL